MAKPKILFIKTGGTICQKPNDQGVLEPSPEDYLQTVNGLENLAQVDVVDVGLLDSTDMGTSERAKMAETIFDVRKEYDGFVVAHGTDTMVETAAALTYMLKGFRKPIVLTGSQKPAWVGGSDAQNNVYYAVQTATRDIGETVICFGDFVLRGTRAKKVDEEGWNAFNTPGLAPLGKRTSLEAGIALEDHRIKRGDNSRDASLFTGFETGIFNYDHTSGSSVVGALESVVDNPEIKGILMGGFGAGNIPTNLLPLIRRATSQGKPVAVYTKCLKGAADMAVYAVGSAALDAGAIPAGDMTPEALGQKLMYALGLAEGSIDFSKRIEFVKKIISHPIGKDITVTELRK